MSALPTTTAIAPWFGSNRILANHVGEELAGCSWVGIPFAGGMCETAYIKARSLYVNDAHRAVINLARVARDPKLGPKLWRQIRRTPFHPDELTDAQARCRAMEFVAAGSGGGLFSSGAVSAVEEPCLAWAVDYFVAVWMARSGDAGTKREFSGGMSIRWDAGGGDSATRCRSAARSYVAWRKILDRANFTTLDGFEFIETVKDEPGIGLYEDPPFPGPGDAYKHTFGEAGQRRLAKLNHRFSKSRLVLRYYDHSLVRELYPEGRWTWVWREGRKQTNGKAEEVLIINGPSLAKGAA